MVETYGDWGVRISQASKDIMALMPDYQKVRYWTDGQWEMYTNLREKIDNLPNIIKKPTDEEQRIATKKMFEYRWTHG